MASIQTIVETATRTLAEIKPENITADLLSSSILKFGSLDVNEAIDQYWRELPEKPENEQDLPAWENKMQLLGKSLNHHLHGFNEELNRVKNMRSTLSLPALDPLIKAAREIIRPLYDFTAQLTN
jgi:hypothetical protein